MTSTTDRLLDAVDEVIAVHGPSGVTLRRVGEQAGLSHTAAAHYYRNKPGLFTAYITRAYDTIADSIELAAAGPEPRTAMLDAADSYAEFAVAHPAAFSVSTRLELVNLDPPALWAARERGYFALAGILQRGLDAGWSTERDLLDLIAITWGLVHGVVDLWVGGPLSAPYDGQELRPTLRRLLIDVLDSLDS